MKTLLIVSFAVAVVSLTAVCVPSVHAEGSGLVGMLTSQLGVTSEQASGGSGAILNYAKQKLSADDFSKVTDAMPETESLIESAPKTSGGGLAGKLGGASSLLGGGDKGGSLTGMAGLADSFSSLGLNADMIGKFTPIILDYAESKGGETVAAILKGVLQ